MAGRELVMGGGNCEPSSSTNPFGALANALIGSSSTKEKLQEIPTSTTRPSDGSYFAGEPLSVLPGSEFDHPQQLHSQGSAFLQGFHAGDQNGLSDAWNEIQRPQVPYGAGGISNFPMERTPLPPTVDGPPQRVLSSFLHSFINSSHGGIPFHPARLPMLGLSQGDKQCVRDRASIMARHFFADKNEDFINGQVNSLLSSLDIDNDIRAAGFMPGRSREMEEYWNESQALKPHNPADGWISEFSQNQNTYGGPDSWVQSFEREHGANGWASEFERGQNQLVAMNQMGGVNVPNLALMEQTRMLANTLAQNNDPKFQNSKFFQFMSKMSQGELTIEDDQIKQAVSVPGDWATEYQHQYNGGQAWADQFAHEEITRGPAGWANEFATEHAIGTSNDEWVNEFSKLHVNDDWAEEFGRQVAEGTLDDNTADNWASAYDDYLNEQVSLKQESAKSRGVYEFSEFNPYVGHPNPLKEGQELFRKGLLSEAVLALEAEVLKNPENAEGWRLLGITHAENDDDQQAIAAMMRAHEADSTNLEVLLSLGVSHTNELEQPTALKYLYGWLRHHPKYGTFAAQQEPESLYHADVAGLFNDAAKMSPDDADIHIVLGVLYNLSREYDRAIESFKRALELKPRDYSLWNKLGATQANSIQSADAISAYQKALDLKPNYVRAWANMGISYANQVCFLFRILARSGYFFSKNPQGAYMLSSNASSLR
ncbi:hypothetical protein Leryth_016124 [Lithospermum erythrorhizon]|nr:hypothetical protein Leryth_016124 [Lithospermum erythrorhizon]